MAVVHLGIGSNLGQREKNCLRSIDSLKNSAIEVLKVSAPYETPAWGVEDQPDFINMAAEVETSLSPEGLLKLLKEVEKETGRTETYRWGPRVVDMDILLWEELVIETPELSIPHALMHQREFVLKPLVEIAPEAVHPVLKKTVRELYDTLKG